MSKFDTPVDELPPVTPRNAGKGKTSALPGESTISVGSVAPGGDLSLPWEVEPLSPAELLASHPAAAQLAELETAAPPLSAFLMGEFERMSRRRAGDEKPIPLPWGNLNQTLGGGLWAGVHVLVGGTGTGKSQWALQVAYEAAREGTPVLYIGLELDRLGLIARLAGLVSKVPWSKLYTGGASLTEDEFMRAFGASEALAELPIHLELGDAYGWSYDRLARRAEAIAAKYAETLKAKDADGRPLDARPFLVVLDYLQVVASPLEKDGREDLRQRIQMASYAAREVARKHNAAVLLLCSTARNSYEALDGDEKPYERPAGAMVGLGKESGEIEYAADTVLVMAREAFEKDKPRKSFVGVAKMRAGKLGSVADYGPGWHPMTFEHGLRFEEDNDPKPAKGEDTKAVTAGAAKSGDGPKSGRARTKKGGNGTSGQGATSGRATSGGDGGGSDVTRVFDD